MKKIRYIIIGAILLLSACNDDTKVSVNPDEFAPSEWMIINNSIFPNHGNTFVLDKADAARSFDTLRWSPADFGYNAAVLYSIQMAVQKEDGTFGEFKTVATTTKGYYPLTVNDINSFVLNAGGIKRKETNVLARISSSISSVYPSQVSEGYNFTVTTYSIDPDKLYFVGDYSDNGMEDAEYIFDPAWGGSYNGFAYLPNSTTGLWLVEEIDPDVRWGITSSTEQGSALTLVKESDGGQPIIPGAFGSGDIEASFVDSAYYRVSVNLKESATIKTIQVWRFYSKFFVAGQRNMNYIWWGNNMSGQDPDVPAWNLYPDSGPVVYGTGALLTYYPEERLWKSEAVYIPKFQTGAGTPPQAENTSIFEFKFRANWKGTHNPDGTVTQSWLSAANLGGANNDIADENGMQAGRISGSGNIRFNGVAGKYRIIVSLNNYPNQYQLIPVE